MNFNSAKNATPQDRGSLAKILQLVQQNPNSNWFFNAIQNSQPNGLPTGTQRYDPKGRDGLYTMKLVGSSLLGYPQEGVFNAPNPRSQEDIKASLEQKRVKGLLG